ncbi:lipase maturation factor 2-like [Amphibalanus amphitrite]|uniref:lipase maturation factor 2-like n=1 Tax=Amphibalanus amphitrite TaxID=1232801 RepID=UPI001C9022DA|nr:lipase maturation factor 2-like [Amphibalanus amphitrite]XP_043198943.1 lipase maturation factor 2-like [Amphibalanus amphitrite]
MTATFLTRSLFLKWLAAIYLVAFLSLYMQIPGLFGANGVLPAQSQLLSHPSVASAWARPTLLWLRGYVGLDTSHAMEAASLLGVVLSLLAVVTEWGRVKVVLGALLVLYGSLVQVGQAFLYYQWDSLLLETGLLAVVLAPWLPSGGRQRPSDSVGLWLVRWLLFRQVFSTGAMKLLSKCPSWWSLTALDVHFQSQCMPTPLAAVAHALPPIVLRLATVFSLAAELGGPFLFFSPVRRLRLAGFYLQVFLQLMVFATGSFGFHSLLVLTLCLSLLDDDWLTGRKPQGGLSGGWLESILSGAVLLSLLAATIGLFQIRLQDGGIATDIGFSPEEFGEFIHFAVPASILLGAASFLLTAADAITTAVLDSAGGCCRRMNSALNTTVTVLVAAAVFTCSLVPYTTLDAPTHRTLPEPLRDVFAETVQPLHVFGSYGLFKQMTGVKGRPEVVLQGATKLDGPWNDIEFRYKPGQLDYMPPFVAPHQPRLDWQMWMAALGDYHANPWLTSLAYRILTGQKEVVSLLDTARYPFTFKPPKYIRGMRYTYTYGAGDQQSWWQRSKTGEEYLPVFSAEHKPLLDYLKQLNVIGLPKETTDNPTLIGLLDAIRATLDQWEARNLVWSVLLALWLVRVVTGRVMGSGL